MALAPGAHLGPYEVLGPLGAGGMGEVYRARDPRLGRQVAVKVLPGAASSDSLRLHRFEQEARAAGALNHPGILAVYDVGSHDGAPYIVSELLEGETLRGCLRSAGLTVRKAVESAIQIAHGLAAAHEKGIVHRDLKPENLFLTTDGRLKILDFGLAKLREPRPDAEAEGSTASRTTAAGLLAGTVGYMSPEQVRGLPADHRSDIFSFGIVLYEMLSKRAPFRRETSAETLAAILKEDPPELSALNAEVPPALERIARRCLEKRPEERFQSARDVAFALEALALGASPGAGPQRPTVTRSRRAAWVGLLVALVLLDVAAVWLLAGKRASQVPPPSFRQLTFRRGHVFSARFAPDGQTIVYSAAWDGGATELFTTRAGSRESRPLGISDATLLSISQSGEMAFLLGGLYKEGIPAPGKLAVAALAGGGVREVLDDVRDADWAPDGERLAVVRGSYSLEFPIGRPLYHGPVGIAGARVSPRGDWIAIVDESAAEGRLFGAWIALVDLAGRKTTLSGNVAFTDSMAWSPSGDEIWFTTAEAGSTTLHAVALSGRRRVVATMPGVLQIQDVSSDGRVLMTRQTWRGSISALPPGETKERDLSWLDSSASIDLSSDGKTLLFAETFEGGSPHRAVYSRTTDGGPAVRLGEGRPWALSPDGRWALALPPDGRGFRLFPTGTGSPRSLAPGAVAEVSAASWLPDGKRIVCVGKQPGQGNRLYVQEIEAGEPRAIAPEDIESRPTGLPTDGTWIAAIDSAGRARLYPIAGGPPREIHGSSPGDELLQWSADRRALFVCRRERRAIKLYRLDLASGRRELVRELAPADPAGVIGVSPPCLTPDGRSYAYSYTRILTDLYIVDGLR